MAKTHSVARWRAGLSVLALAAAAGLGLAALLAAARATDAATTVTYQVAASADDTVATSLNHYNAIAYVYWPDSATAYRGYLRWTVNIPPGSTITEAHVSVCGYNSTTTTTVRMQLLDDDSCPAFTSNPYSWAVTPGYVEWTATTWTGGQWYDSPDIKTMVQEFIDRPGYSPGNYLGLRSLQAAGGNYKMISSWDYSNHTYGARLVVTYTTGGPDNQPPVADAGSDQNVTDDDHNVSQAVTLDGSASSDSDGTITGYVWKEGTAEIATASTASVSLAVGTHTITLTVTDDDGATDSDSVIVTVLPQGGTNNPPLANAGADQGGLDSDGDGSVTVTLDGSASSDSDGTITSYVWKELSMGSGGSGSAVTLATSVTASVTLAVGMHDIQLTVTDDDGATATDVVRVWFGPKGNYFVDAASGSDTYPGTESLPYKTIGKAVSVVSAGKTIIVKEGVYREAVSLPVSGSTGNPITLMGYPFQRVVVAGSDAVTGWTQCDSTTAKANPDYANIYYKDIAWKPTRLAQDVEDLSVSRMVPHGSWSATGGTNTTLVDTVNLTQEDDYWNTAALKLERGNYTYRKTVKDFDSATNTITVDSGFGTVDAPLPGDTYVLTNTVQMIDAAGEWAVEDLGGGTYRLYAWCYGGGSPDSRLMEASRRIYCIELGTKGYWTIDNLELRHALSYTGGYGYGVGDQSSGCVGHNVIQNCVIHHHDGPGINLTYNDYTMVRHNYAGFSSHGICMNACNYAVFEENETAWNRADGVRMVGVTGAGWATGCEVRRNYVHDNYDGSAGHPDSIQSFNNLQNSYVTDNLFFCGGQQYMISELTTSTFRGNYFVACAYAGVLMGPNSSQLTLEHNTFAFSGYAMTTHAGYGYNYKNNIFLLGHTGAVYAVAGDVGYVSNYNCFWKGAGLAEVPVVAWAGNWNWTFAQYQSGSGLDANSFYADPLFANVPACHAMVTGTSSTTRIHLQSSDMALFAVDDHIEINYDGVVRTVTAKGTDYLDFTPATEERYLDLDDGMVANWKTSANYGLDFTLQPGSPALSSADDGKNMGSPVNFRNYLNGDFNGDGRRDVPEWPPAVTSLEIAASTDYNWVYQNTPVTTLDRHHCVLTVIITREARAGESYTAAFTENGGALTNFTVESTADPLVWNLVGGRVGSSTAGAPALRTIGVTLTGSQSGRSASAEVAVALRQLGDITGNGAVGLDDKVQINKRLNGLATPGYDLRHFDLNGGGSVGLDDKVILNKVLNGLPIP